MIILTFNFFHFFTFFNFILSLNCLISYHPTIWLSWLFSLILTYSTSLILLISNFNNTTLNFLHSWLLWFAYWFIYFLLSTLLSWLHYTLLLTWSWPSSLTWHSVSTSSHYSLFLLFSLSWYSDLTWSLSSTSSLTWHSFILFDFSTLFYSLCFLFYLTLTWPDFILIFFTVLTLLCFLYPHCSLQFFLFLYFFFISFFLFNFYFTSSALFLLFTVSSRPVSLFLSVFSFS